MRLQRWIALGVLVLGIGVCWAASQNATVTGGVYDATGKPLAGMRVVLENPALGFERETTTIDDGSYTFTQVPPQDGYRLTAFRETTMLARRVSLTIAVGEDKSILPPLREEPPVAATAGEVKEQSAAVVTNETISTSVSGVITGEQLRFLPLFNRNFLALGLLTPNTHDVEAGSGLAGATFSIGGSRPDTNMFLLDGVENVAHSSNQAIPFQVNDSVQEFRVISSTASAEYGGGSGGVINIVTRRGSNGFHGSAFGYFSNDSMNADSPLSVYSGTGFDKAAAYAGNATVADDFAPQSYNSYVATAQKFGFCTDSIGGSSSGGRHACAASGGFGNNTLFNPAAILSTNDSHSQPFSSKQFGLNMGDALIKDKLFIFGSYEGTKIDNPNQIFERVPSTFDKTYNPLLAAGMPGATNFHFSSGNRNFLMAQKVLGLFPAANVVGVPNALEFFKGKAPNYTDVHNGLLRTDWVQSSRNTWSFRYSGQDLNQLHDDSFPSGGAYPGNGAFRDAFNQNITLTNTHVINAKATLESRLGFTRFRVNETPQDSNFDATTLGFPTNRMMTVSLGGLDPQYSGATTKQTGAFANWIDSYWLLACPNASATNCVPGFPFADYFDQVPSLSGQFPMARLGAPLNAPGQHRDSTWLLDENLSHVHGRHTTKYGFSYRYLQSRAMNAAFSRGLMEVSNIGEFTSDSMSTILGGSPLIGDALPAFTTPSFDYALRQPAPYVGRFSSFAASGFFQDVWRVNSRVSANFGVRYDYFSTPHEANNNIWNYDPTANGLVQAGTTNVVDPFGNACKTGKPVPAASIYPVANYVYGWGCSPSGTGKLPDATAYNFGPRGGIAWDLFGNGASVLRGGFGMFFNQEPLSYAEQLMYNRPTLLDLKNPELIYGQQFYQVYTSPVNGKQYYGCFQCGLGNTSVSAGYFTNPAVQNIINPTLNSLAQAQGASSPMAVYAQDNSHYNSPMTTQLNLSWQQRVTNHIAVETGYLQTLGERLPVVYNAGFNNEWFCTANPPKYDSNGNLISNGCDGVSPVMMLTNRAHSTYRAFMTRVRAAEIHGLTLNATYTYSGSHDNASSATYPLIPVTLANEIFAIQNLALGVPFSGGGFGGGGNPGARGLTLGSDVLAQGLTTTGQSQALVSRYSLPQNPINFLKDDWGRSDFDMAHRLVLDYVWDAPLLKHASHSAANWFGLWQFSGTLVAQAGQPFTVFSGPIGGEMTQRAQILSAPTINSSNPNQYINSDVFALPSQDPACAANYGVARSTTAAPSFQLFSGTILQPCVGNTERNQFTGPNLIQMNMAVQKGVQVAEGKLFTIRAEFYNLFNRANYYNPISALSVDGTTVNPDFGKIKSAHEPFQVQLSARFNW